MTDTVVGAEWTPIQQAGPNSGPIAMFARSQIIMRLQDGLLVARARRVVQRTRSKASEIPKVCERPQCDHLQASASFPAEVIVTHESDVILSSELWESDRLGYFDHGFWEEGDQRIVDLTTVGDDYDGDHTTYYGIEIRDAVDISGERATHDEVLSWCVNWIARQRSAGLGAGENAAWPEFRNDVRHVGLSREDVFRPAFRAAKSGKR